MAKLRIGSVKQRTLIEGDANLLVRGEILVTKSDGYTILRERLESGKIKSYIVMPLDELTKIMDSKKEERAEEVKNVDNPAPIVTDTMKGEKLKQKSINTKKE